MKFTNFTQAQRDALLDLLVLATYADGHLALAEDARLQQVLTAMDIEAEDERRRAVDGAFTRIRRYAQAPKDARAHATELVKQFTTKEQRWQVSDLLDDLIGSDDQVTPQESQFLSEIRELFRVSS